MAVLRFDRLLLSSSTFPFLASSSGNRPRPRPPPTLRLKAAVTTEKPETCTADELHYVPVSSSDWKLALWRYLPSPNAQEQRNHPLLLLSGIGTNATGYDLSPESSFARYMAAQGFDTWILEVRGSGLSSLEVNYGEDSEFSSFEGELISKSGKNLSPKLSERYIHLLDSMSGAFGEGENSAVAIQIKDFSRKLLDFVEQGQKSERAQFFNFQQRFSTTIEDFLNQLDMLVKYDWDFDNYLEEDLPAALDYIRTQSRPNDGKLLAIGHSMGGILLYARLSRCCYEGKESGLASIATLGSSLDYTNSRSSLKMLLPMADPAKALNVRAIPLGALMSVVHPFTSRPPYILSWLNAQISAPGMMHPQLVEKLVMKNFGTIPAKLLLQMSTAFYEGGLRNRGGSICYKGHLRKSNVPMLAIAGNQDLICPPEAVYETIRLIPEHLVTYKVFGEPWGPQYAHYDLVGGRMAAYEVYPCIINFLSRHDK